MGDTRLVKWLIAILLLPLILAMCSNSGGDHFRYPCQDPANWDKDICKWPQCDVTRTCPEHVFKGQRDPRLGPPKDEPIKANSTAAPAMGSGIPAQGANCVK